MRHLLESERVLTPCSSSTGASVIAVRCIAAFVRSMLGSFAVGRGQRLHCLLHLRGSAIGEADFGSAFAASGGRGHSSRGSTAAATASAVAVMATARSQLAGLKQAVSRWLPLAEKELLNSGIRCSSA